MEYLSSLSPSTDNSHLRKLDNLPDLVYYHILKHLHLDDIWSLRLINKRFYFIINDHNIIELVLLNRSSQINASNWFSTTKVVKLGHHLYLSKLDLLRYPSTNLLNLKYLKIMYRYEPLITFKDLNQFTKLQVLELEWSFKSSKNHLRLPVLRALSIIVYGIIDEEFPLIIDTPQLHSLQIYKDLEDDDLRVIDDKINFKHPLSIRNLCLSYYDQQVSIFKNLESLEFIHRKFELRNFDVDDLLRLKSLKKLKIVFNATNRDFDKLKDLFKSKKIDLVIVLCGVRVKEISKFDECEEKEHLEYQLDNYDELEDGLNFVNYIEYNKLVSLLPNQPADLFSKYTNIQHLMANKRIEDENRLIRFIRECKNLSRLSITGSSLSQQLYDQLPAISSLTWLRIYEKEVNLSFKFIMKISYLKYFETDQDVLLSDQMNLNNLKHLDIFEFKIGKKKFSIRKASKNRYSIDSCKLLDLFYNEYFNHNDLVKWLNRLRDNEKIDF